MKLDYRLEGDVMNSKRGRSRVRIVGAPRDRDHVIDGSVTMPDQFSGDDECDEHTVYIKVSASVPGFVHVCQSMVVA